MEKYYEKEVPHWDWSSFDHFNKDDLSLRLATNADFPFVEGLVCHPSTLEAMSDTLESAEATLRSLWAEGFDAPEMRHFLVEAKQFATPVAYLRLLYPFIEPRCLWLSFIAVVPLLRRRGYGRRILHLLLAAAKSTGGVSKFGMHALSSIIGAMRLYESAGFQCTCRELWQAGDGTPNERLTFSRVIEGD